MTGALRILVSGMLAGVPGQGGATWAVLQYVLGFRRLGHDVWFVEQVPSAGVSRQVAAYFGDVASAFGLEERATLLAQGTREALGVPYGRLADAARSADVLVNLAGTLTDPPFVEAAPVRLYVDLDPAFTQLWEAVEGIDMRLAGHTHHATVGQAIGRPECPIPTCGRQWLGIAPPVDLRAWGPVATPPGRGLTTVGNWRGYGSIVHDGIAYGQRAHSMRELLGLAERVPDLIELALAIDPGERQDLAALRAHGWRLLDPAVVAATPERYRAFVRSSAGELGIAKSGYVASRCGWFSDRSACYLASGRPVIAQDTGFPAHLPTGQGLLSFRDTDGAAAAVEALRSDYPRHARAARALAEEHFDSARVLSGLLDRVGASARSTPA